jgi:hypothetical protein
MYNIYIYIYIYIIYNMLACRLVGNHLIYTKRVLKEP